MGENLTVGEVKEEIITQIKSVDNIAKINDTIIQEILGDAMVESIADHSVTIDKCEAVSGVLNLPRLFTLAGEPPFTYNVFGLTEKLAENIKLIYNTSQPKVGKIYVLSHMEILHEGELRIYYFSITKNIFRTFLE